MEKDKLPLFLEERIPMEWLPRLFPGVYLPLQTSPAKRSEPSSSERSEDKQLSSPVPSPFVIDVSQRKGYDMEVGLGL